MLFLCLIWLNQPPESKDNTCVHMCTINRQCDQTAPVRQRNKSQPSLQAAAHVHIRDKRGWFNVFLSLPTFSAVSQLSLFVSVSFALSHFPINTHVRSRPLFKVTRKIIKQGTQIMSSSLIGSCFHSWHVQSFLSRFLRFFFWSPDSF